MAEVKIGLGRRCGKDSTSIWRCLPGSLRNPASTQPQHGTETSISK